LSLPEAFRAQPKLSSPLTIDRGTRPRSVDFIPGDQDIGVPGFDRIESRDGSQGREVEVYERLGLTSIWYLRWPLTEGFLYLHLREEDWPGYAGVVVDNLEIVEEIGAPPFLLPSSPLSVAVSENVGYQEHASFGALEQDWAVFLRRPGFLRPGQLMEYPDEKAILRGGGAFGIEVTVMSSTDRAAGEDLLDLVLESLDEA
jgi:hypothetical protein